MGTPVKSINAFLNQQLLTHIVVHRQEPMQGPVNQHVSVCRCQTGNAGLAFGWQAFMPPSQSVSDTLGRNMDTREQKMVLMPGCCIPTTPPPLLVYFSVR